MPLISRSTDLEQQSTEASYCFAEWTVSDFKEDIATLGCVTDIGVVPEVLSKFSICE
jgi:hypothetical protein